MPPATIEAFLDHGKVEADVEKDVSGAEQTMSALASVGIDMEQVTAKLLTDGVKAFIDSFDKLMYGIEEKRARL